METKTEVTIDIKLVRSLVWLQVHGHVNVGPLVDWQILSLSGLLIAVKTLFLRKRPKKKYEVVQKQTVYIFFLDSESGVIF